MLEKELNYEPPNSPLNIIFKDPHIIVVDKPTGLLTVPGKRKELKDSLICRLKRKYLGTLLVHRLDMDTSGLIIFARTLSAQKKLNKQFEKRLVEKTYIARVWGKPLKKEGIIKFPLIADFENKPKQKICYDYGKESTTKWHLKSFSHSNGNIFSNLIINPITGRSHQIRIHLASINMPILGDSLYAHEKAFLSSSRLLLHSKILKIKHPSTDKILIFKSEESFD